MEGTIYLNYDKSYEPDYKLASKRIYPPNGVVIVEMLLPESISKGGILLTENTLFTHYGDDDAPIGGIEPSVGVIIGLGPDMSDLKYGDKVIVRDGDGYCQDNFSVENIDGNYFATGEVRVFGRVVPPAMGEGYIEDLPVEESIFAVERDGQWTAYGKNIKIRKDPFEEREGSIFLLGRSQVRNSQATVVEVGPDCDLPVFDPETLELRTVREGDRILYHNQAQYNFVDKDKDIAFIREKAVLAVLS